MTPTETRADKLAKIEAALIVSGAPRQYDARDIAARILDALHPRTRKSVKLPDGSRVEWRAEATEYRTINAADTQWIAAHSVARVMCDAGIMDAAIADLTVKCLALRENDGYESETARETSVVLANGWTVRWDGDAYKAVGATVRRFSSAARCVRELIGVYGDDTTVSRLLALRGTP